MRIPKRIVFAVLTIPFLLIFIPTAYSLRLLIKVVEYLSVAILTLDTALDKVFKSFRKFAIAVAEWMESLWHT